MNAAMLGLGIIASLILSSYLPILAALTVAVAIQEKLLYDLHKHILFLEDINNE